MSFEDQRWRRAGNIQATVSKVKSAAAFQRAYLKCKQRWYSLPVGCCLTSVPFMLFFVLSHSELLHRHTHVHFSLCLNVSLLPGTHLVSSIAPSLYFLFPLTPLPPNAPTPPPPPPDNDVLIMRLLGQQIALLSHSHAVENCCCLGATTPLCVSGRLTLASCWERCSSTRAGALSPSL